MHNPYFIDARQAVHFAFVLREYPVVSRSTIRVAIEQTKILGGARSSIDLACLSPADMRAECGRIVQLVNRLELDSRNALLARFSHVQAEAERAITHMASIGAQALSDTILDRQLVQKIARREYRAPGTAAKGWTIRDIADEFQASKDRVHRASVKFATIVRLQELVAIDNLRRELEAMQFIKPMEEHS